MSKPLIVESETHLTPPLFVLVVLPQQGAMLHAVELAFQELVEHQAGRRPTCGPILERTAAVLVNRIQVQVAS
jgi:hypothetical protein